MPFSWIPHEMLLAHIIPFVRTGVGTLSSSWLRWEQSDSMYTDTGFTIMPLKSHIYCNELCVLRFISGESNGLRCNYEMGKCAAFAPVKRSVIFLALRNPLTPSTLSAKTGRRPGRSRRQLALLESGLNPSKPQVNWNRSAERLGWLRVAADRRIRTRTGAVWRILLEMMEMAVFGELASLVLYAGDIAAQ